MDDEIKYHLDKLQIAINQLGTELMIVNRRIDKLQDRISKNEKLTADIGTGAIE